MIVRKQDKVECLGSSQKFRGIKWVHINKGVLWGPCWLVS